MLVLSRKKGESVDLFVRGLRIRVSVIEVPHGRKVRLGFEAPADEVTIHRSEIAVRAGLLQSIDGEPEGNASPAACDRG